MKKVPYKGIYCLLLLLLAATSVPAQRSYVRHKIEKDMEKKYADPQKKKGKEALEKVTYENDKRYKDPKNKVQATFVFASADYDKKGNLKEASIDKIVFGKTGECMVSNEGEKNETWFVYNYADKANYMVQVKDKTAMKMPLINMQKMAEKMAKKEAAKEEQGEQTAWVATSETRVINGFNCKQYIYTYPANPKFSTYEAWVSNDVKIKLDGNYMMGARVQSYNFTGTKTNKNLPMGYVVLGILYNKKGKPVNQRELKEMTKGAEERYFDMSPFKVNDVLDALQ
ncbi:hypothetical protein DBR32_06790 [Taibaiella sp. KBW10]|uniref:hypothetical protein n=1 Tax=Taibaiella sp. KBW10 TaxID=2153357 RepID=UPI000F592F7F|nr:hypothetical protein [Taibaiella sp. KBW10]RQO31652.1 hypothetical protein DBR32_06790 [Taibaiella sp. KBW10]